ncbi:hypothetical protein K439DRAFT_1339193, partial [Ramaria rubella]
LHPRYKTSYFCHEKWPEDWITTALTMLHDEWQENYKPTLPVAPVVVSSRPEVGLW